MMDSTIDQSGVVRLGTRGSALAVTQSGDVAAAITAASGLQVELVTIKTHGDVSTEPLAQLGGTGVFVSALRAALLEQRCDIAVHSLKDLPTAPADGIALAAIPERVDARDALCARDGLTLASLPREARIGTGSPRRAAQLLALRPDLEIIAIRGNVDTRLARVGQDLDAIVLAAAGLERLGRGAEIAERFTLETFPTAPGQGALAVEVRGTDAKHGALADALRAIDDRVSRATALAERAVLRSLEAGCAAPVGASAHVEAERITLSAVVYSLDGTRSLSATQHAGISEAEVLGETVARELLDGGVAQFAPIGEAQ